jgi:hypothetical protein
MIVMESRVRTDMTNLTNQYPGGIYLHWDYWVNYESRFANQWRQLILDTHATVVDRMNAEAVQFALFRLDTPYARTAMGGEGIIQGRPPIDVDRLAAEALATPSPAVNAPKTTATHSGVPSSSP